MARQTTFKRLSRRARSLLSTGENKVVDYKSSLKGIHSEDLVAFANSAHGGAILVGVEEVPTEEGLHKGEPVGCPVDDQARLQIMGKALACSPAIQIELYVENTGDRPFFRIEIPSGSHKPYCSGSGTYKIREDGRNVPLLPDELLKMFLDREGKEFRSRFTQATEGLEAIMREAAESAEGLERVISSKIEDIGSSLGWAEYKAIDAADTIETVEARVSAISSKQEKIGKRLKALLQSSGVADPVKMEAEHEVLEFLKAQLTEDPSILEAIKNGQSLSVQLTGEVAAELTKEDLNRLFTQAVQEHPVEETDS